jgi:hypothetical protein
MIERHEALQWESTGAQPPDTELRTQPAGGAIPNVPADAASTGVIETNVNVAPSVDTAQPTRSPAMPALQLLGSPPFLGALWGIFVLAALMTAFDSVISPFITGYIAMSVIANTFSCQTLPIYTSDLFGFNSLGGGATLFALLGPSLAGPIAGECDYQHKI